MNNKDLLKTIISDNQTKDLPHIWERQLKIPLNLKKIVTLSGVRRSGKTYHLFNLIKTFKTKGVNPQKIIYLNFEDERLNLKKDNLDQIIQAHQELYPGINLSNCYFFFDEVQTVNGWEQFVTRLSNTITKNIFITGSNASLLSQEIATSLRGKTLTYEVFPFSFTEFINTQKPNLNINISQDQSLAKKLFQDFIKFGGFPEILNANQEIKVKTLQEYFNTMILRDIIDRYQVSQPAILKYFTKKVIANSATEFSNHKIYNEIKSQGYKISKDSIYSFQDYVQNIYLSLFVSKYSPSIIKREFSQKKAYCIDTGLASTIDYKFSQDKGRQLENTVALEFVKQGKQINYLQNGYECDFIISTQNKPIQAVQVCLNLENQATKKREINGLIKACQRLGLTTGTIITLDEQQKIKQQNISITIVPAWKHFL